MKNVVWWPVQVGYLREVSSVTAQMANQTVEKVDQNGVAFRVGTLADSRLVFEVFERTLADLNRRMGGKEPTSASDPI